VTKTEHLLSCLAEECAEVAQRASKAMRFGLDDIEPGQELNNAERIIYELTDLCAVIEMLSEQKIINPFVSPGDAINRKKEKVARYMEYAIQRGAITK
jgi:NTP pyrophosphatase (non-canonical NTP hydrolase)